MSQVSRKIICEVTIGSHLYGTSTPESDLDLSGVFLPSTNDLLGIQNCPTEWTENRKISDGPRNTAGDIDCKFYSIKRFMQLAEEGQPGQIELLFAPEAMIRNYCNDWQRILDNRSLFLSKQAIAPFLGFAKAQTHKAKMKGETLNLIHSIIDYGEVFLKEHPGATVIDAFTRDPEPGELGVTFDWEQESWFMPLKMNDQGFWTVEGGGSSYDIKLKLKRFLENMRAKEKKYGGRSRKAAESGFDFESLTHAYRLMFEGCDFLSTGELRFPISGSQPGLGDRREWLMKCKAGDPYMETVRHDVVLSALQEQVREAEAASSLPDKPDSYRINELCREMLHVHLVKP